MGVNKYASTFPFASCNKKTCNYRRKKCGVKNMKIRNCITTLHKHPIDPKAYLGRCKHVFVHIGIASRRQFQYVPTTNDFLLNEGFSLYFFFLTNVKIFFIVSLKLACRN